MVNTEEFWRQQSQSVQTTLAFIHLEVLKEPCTTLTCHSMILLQSLRSVTMIY